MGCPVCGAPTLVGALLCVCGSPLAAPAAPCAAPASAPAPVAVACPPSPAGRALRVLGGAAEFALPGADFDELLLGRHDLEARPPVVVDLDLGPIAPKRTGGFLISRRQARLTRRSGRLFLAALGGAQTLCRKPGADFLPLAAGQEIELSPGDRLAFGSGDSALVLELT